MLVRMPALDHSPAVPTHCDLAVIGSGAAGLFAAIWAGRTLRSAGSKLSVIALDGAPRLGAKILVAGGGRCNVTHHAVDESAYSGSTPAAIRNVLRRFPVASTVSFFNELNVEFKREPTGKLFPTTDDAHTVLDALLTAAHQAGVQLVHPWRVEAVTTAAPTSSGFTITNAAGLAPIHARRIILATGGKSLPKTGSDGHGHALVRILGHTLTPRVFPALVPLVLESSSFVRTLSGITIPATVGLSTSSGKRLVEFTNSTLCTHFGLSGPGVLDISRHYTAAHVDDAGAQLHMNWLPGQTFDHADRHLAQARTTPARALSEHLPERLSLALCAAASVDPSLPCAQLKRDDRRKLAHALTHSPLPVTGDRGWLFAEVTAGGVPLSELHLAPMESRPCPGLHLCGEICDVDGRIGGFNFQWAWASGFVAGSSAASALIAS